MDLAVVKSLLEEPRGADPNIRDNEGKTALDWALSIDLKNSDECRELLRKYMSPPPSTTLREGFHLASISMIKQLLWQQPTI